VTLDDPIDGNADAVFWALENMGPGESRQITGQCAVTCHDEGVFDVELAGTRLERVDLLVAHQAILRGEPSDLSLEDIDYATTGLCLQTALVDYGQRKKRLGLPLEIPPTIRWGERRVATGDIRPVPAGRVTVTVSHLTAGVRHGIALSTAHGPEHVLWPSENDREFTVDLPHDADLRITTVFVVEGPGWSREERWLDNAGMWIGPDGAYHCNHFATTPPTFEDLVFTVRS
jgi:hypothetical protein